MKLSIDDQANILNMIVTLSKIIIGLGIPYKVISRLKSYHEQRKEEFFRRVFNIQNQDDNRQETLV